MSLEIPLAGRVTIGTEGVLIEEERLPGREGPGRTTAFSRPLPFGSLSR
jgi:hypothetical protein